MNRMTISSILYPHSIYYNGPAKTRQHIPNNKSQGADTVATIRVWYTRCIYRCDLEDTCIIEKISISISFLFDLSLCRYVVHPLSIPIWCGAVCFAAICLLDVSIHISEYLRYWKWCVFFDTWLKYDLVLWFWVFETFSFSRGPELNFDLNAETCKICFFNFRHHSTNARTPPQSGSLK